MSVLVEIADALDKARARLSGCGDLHLQSEQEISYASLELRALAERPTSADVKMLDIVAQMLAGTWIVSSASSTENVAALRALAARLTAQQSAPAEQPAASPWEGTCGECRGEGQIINPARSLTPGVPQSATRSCRECHGSGRAPTAALLALIEVLNRHTSLWKAW